MKRLVSTKKISHEEWLTCRKKGITGTDAGSIVGLNPYKSAFAVYQDKITDSIDHGDNEAMRQGRDLEDYVAKRFCEQTGFKVRRANAIFYNEMHPFMLADFDRLLVGMKTGLECKTVSPYSTDSWKDGKIPLHYQMQIQHYLAVSGYKSWYLAAMIMGQEFLIHKIHRDEEMINHLIAIEKNFWVNHVLSRVMPEPDGTDNCSQLIQKMYFKGDKKQIVNLRNSNSLLDRRAELEKLIKKMETEKTAIDQKLKLELGEAALGISDSYRVSWSSFEQTRLDAKKLKTEKPDVYDSYCKTSRGRRFVVVRTS